MKQISNDQNVYRCGAYPLVRTLRIGASLFISAWSLVICRQAIADLVVTPNSAANSPAIGSQIPFDVSGGRYLNIYNASEFLSAMPNGGRITAIAFRLDETVQDDFAVRVPDVEVRLSTSGSTAPVIPLPFSENVGADETTVFRGSLDAAVRGNGSGTNPFEVILQLTRSFDYDPRHGSLAVDLLTYTASSDRSIRLDAGGFGGAAIFGSIGDPQAVVGLPQLVMQVQFTPVPEPSIMVLFIVGAILVARRL